MILSKEKYQKTVKRPYPPLLGSLVLTGITDEGVYEGLFSQPYARKDSLLCDSVWYNNGEAEDFGRHLIATEWASSEAINRLSKICREREYNLLESVAKPFEIFSKEFENYMVALTLVFLAEQPFYKKLKDILSTKISEKETLDLLAILNVPLEDNFHKKEERDIVLAADLQKHVNNYKWFLSRNGANTPYTLEQAQKRLSEIDKEKFLKEYKESKDEIKKAIGDAKKIVGNEHEYLVDGLQFIVFYRTHRTDIMSKAIFLHIPILESIAKEAHLAYEDILFCLEDEILKKEIPSKAIIEERKRGYAIAEINNTITCFVGKEFEKLRDSLEDTIESVKEIKGTSASKGIVSGRVRIINNSNDFDKIREGDVLVTSMTTPEMVPIMKQAVAFVTDEGGIICHAAIVVRELKKPCIIGTKIATKVLRDGDMVEVDADNGLVRIL